MFRSEFLISLLLATGLLLSGCTSIHRTYQRAYVEPEYLDPSGKIVKVEKKGKLVPADLKDYSEKISRRFGAEGISITVTPNVSAIQKIAFQDEAYRNKMTKTDAKKFVDEKMAAVPAQNCFDVKLTSLNPANADLNSISVFLEPKGASLIELKPSMPNVPPIKETEVETSHDYTSTYLWGHPPTTTVYSVKIYRNANQFCTPAPTVLNTGFTIYVDPRGEKGLPVAELVWLTGEDEKDLYPTFPGLPSHIHSANAAWAEKRARQVEKKIRGLAE